jgi:hypothetical protein
MRAITHDPIRAGKLSVPQLRRDTEPLDGPFSVFALVDRYPPYVCAGAELMLAAMLRHVVERGHRAMVATPVKERAVIDGVEIFPMDCADELAEVSDVMVGHLAFTREVITTAAKHEIPLLYLTHNDMQANYWRLSRDNLTAMVFNAAWMKAAHPAWQEHSIVCRPPTQLRDYHLDREPPHDGFVTLVNPNPEKGAQCFYDIAKRRHRDRFLIVEGGYGTQIRPPKGAGNVSRQPRTANMRDDVYARTRLLLVPSSYESWGRVATEALCSGIPVIAHPTAGLKEALGPAGLFRDRDDPKSWCSLIDELGKRDTYRIWSARARDRAAVLDAQSAADLGEWERLLARCARVRREL